MHLNRAVIEKKAGERQAALMRLAERYRKDPALRARLAAGETAEALAEIGVSVPPGVEVCVIADTADTLHVVMPTDPNTDLSDESLGSLAAGGKTVACGAASTNNSCCVGSLGEIGSSPGGNPPSSGE